MHDYISRAAVQDVIAEVFQETDMFGAESACYIIGERVKSFPAADVKAIKHGTWTVTVDGAAYCSACKRKMNRYLLGYAYCAACGARMDGEYENG